ncbi:MAG: hypothetical protein ACKPHU_17405 [Planctomycetaceae bacterium]
MGERFPGLKSEEGLLERVFRESDSDSDGKLSFAEFDAARPAPAARCSPGPAEQPAPEHCWSQTMPDGPRCDCDVLLVPHKSPHSQSSSLHQSDRPSGRFGTDPDWPDCQHCCRTQPSAAPCCPASAPAAPAGHNAAAS